MAQGDQSAGRVPARVLVVDDSEAARQVIVAVLEADGFRVDTCGTGAEGVRSVQQDRPDLVVLDIVMPEMDGLEACRRIRQMHPEDPIPILFLTGESGSEVQEAAIEAGGDDLIHKPSLQRELIIRVRSLLRIRRLQDALRQEHDALAAARMRQEQLFQFIIHDLKNPLQALDSTLDLLALKGVPEPITPYLQRMRETSGGMGRMIQDLLDVSRDAHAGLQPHPTGLPMARELTDWVKDLEGQMARRGQRLTVEVPPDLEGWGDRDLLRRAVLNLVANASKYSPEGSGIRVEARKDQETLRIEVEDEGPGIPPEHRLAIFERFTRLDATRTGSGLGLAFVRLAAEVHRGRAWVEPKAPRGSRFCLAWPAGPPS